MPKMLSNMRMISLAWLKQVLCQTRAAQAIGRPGPLKPNAGAPFEGKSAAEVRRAATNCRRAASLSGSAKRQCAQAAERPSIEQAWRCAAMARRLLRILHDAKSAKIPSLAGRLGS